MKLLSPFIRRATLGMVTLMLVLVGIGCGSNSTPFTPANPGNLIDHQLIKTYETADFEKIRTIELDSFFIMASMKAADFRGGLVSGTYKKVALHRVAYESVIPELGNQRVIAYGLVAIPEGATNGTPVVSYQHGTVFEKDNAPSNPDASMETKLALLQFASQGYIVVAADYFGNGPLSTLPNSYFVKRSTEQAMFDMHTASMSLLKSLNITPGKLFLLGWSQGGYNTLLHFRMLEKANIPIAAVATASGPGDPLRMITHGMYNPRDFDAVFEAPALSNLIFAYEGYYQLPNISKLFIKTEKLEAARDFYDFRMGWFEYRTYGSDTLAAIFQPVLFETGKTVGHPFWELLSNAASYRFLGQAPLRQYYSSRDEVVTADVGKIAVDYQTSLGKPNATSHDAGKDADHRSVYLKTLVEVKPWFDSLR